MYLFVPMGIFSHDRSCLCDFILTAVEQMIKHVAIDLIPLVGVNVIYNSPSEILEGAILSCHNRL